MPCRSFSSKSYPDHTILKMPALSPTMEKGNLVSWQKNEGDEIKAGESMAEVETDKATVAFDSVEEGYLAKILVQAGTSDIQVGTPVAVVVEEKGDIDAFKDFKPEEEAGAAGGGQAEAEAPAPPQKEEPKQPEPKREAKKETKKESQPPQRGTADRIKASPYAKKMADELGVDLSQVRGTGPEGRIVEADVQEQADQAKAGKPAAAEGRGAVGAPLQPGEALKGAYTDHKNSNVRKTIATRLLQSKQQIPHYYLTQEINIDKLLQLRQELNTHLAKQTQTLSPEQKPLKLSVNDMIVKASALALRKVPTVNSSWTDEAIREYHYVDISVAVATEGGLITPIVKDADKKGLSAISQETKELAKKARAGKLQPQEYQGGTFTISNLGMFGINHFTAIINPPQSCILAVGSTLERVIVDKDNTLPGQEPKFKVANILTVTMSCDHRVVDGAVGSQFLQAFKAYMENPQTMML